MCSKLSTMFGTISEKSVTFVIDISGSMYNTLDCVKGHLIKAINELSLKSSDAMFNIIAFSDEVERFSGKALPCIPKTVSIATNWIRNLECQTTTNTRDALLLAFDDYATESVYLVTDGLPNQSPTSILQHVSRVTRICPVHCIYLTGSEDDDAALLFLKDLAAQTNGSVHTVSFHKNGSLKHMRKVFPTMYDGKVATRSLRNVRFDTDKTQYSRGELEQFEASSYISSTANGYTDYSDTSKQSFTMGHHVMSSSFAASLMLGLKVLAQNYADGFYYFGKITDVMHNDKFMVEFHGSLGMQGQVHQQETRLQDLVAHEDAIRHDILEGDKVLAPMKRNKIYGPGTVVKGADYRQKERNGYEDSTITVTFFNGESREIDAWLPVWISDELFDRIQRSFSLPESLRRGYKDVKYLPSEYRTCNGMKERSLATPMINADTLKDISKDSLREKIEQQIKEGERLLQELKLEELEISGRTSYQDWDSISDNDVPSTAPYSKIKRPYVDIDSFKASKHNAYLSAFRATPKPKKDAWVVETENCIPIDPTSNAIEERREKSSIKHAKEEGYHKHRLELLNHWEKHKNTPKYAPYPPKEDTLKNKVIKNNRSPRGNPRRSKKHRKVFYHPNVKLYQNELKSKDRVAVHSRLNAKEYETFDGVKFPKSTDRKFLRNGTSETWTPDDVIANRPTEQDYNIITHMPVQSYSTNFVNGFGARDLPRDISNHVKDELRKAAKERRKQKMVREKGRKEQIVKDRQDFHRITTARREQKWETQAREMTEAEEKNQKHKREIKESIERFYKEKEEKAQRFKQERLDKMRQRREAVERINLENENAAFESDQRQQAENASNENSRRNAFEVNLQREITNQEKKLERLRKIHEARLNRDDVRRDRAFKSRDLDSHVRDQSRQMYRASILP